MARQRMRQLVDWKAAFRAGLVGWVVFLAVSMLLNAMYVGSPWVATRLLASIILGPGALPPPATFTPGTAIVAALVSLVLALAYAALIAYVVHRWGMIVGIIGGTLLGLAVYVINFYLLSYFFPWFFPLRSWIMAASHALLGGFAGGVYEALEVERFVPADD